MAKKKGARPPGGIIRSVATSSVSKPRDKAEAEEAAAAEAAALEQAIAAMKKKGSKRSNKGNGADEPQKSADDIFLEQHERYFKLASENLGQDVYRSKSATISQSSLPKDIPLGGMNVGLLSAKFPAVTDVYRELLVARSMGITDQDFKASVEETGKLAVVEWLLSSQHLENYIERALKKKTIAKEKDLKKKVASATKTTPSGKPKATNTNSCPRSAKKTPNTDGKEQEAKVEKAEVPVTAKIENTTITEVNSDDFSVVDFPDMDSYTPASEFDDIDGEEVSVKKNDITLDDDEQQIRGDDDNADTDADADEDVISVSSSQPIDSVKPDVTAKEGDAETLEDKKDENNVNLDDLLGDSNIFDVEFHQNDSSAYETSKVHSFDVPKGWTGALPFNVLKTIAPCTLNTIKYKGGFQSTITLLKSKKKFVSVICDTKLHAIDYASIMALYEVSSSNVVIRFAPCWRDVWRGFELEAKEKLIKEKMDLFKWVEKVAKTPVQTVDSNVKTKRPEMRHVRKDDDEMRSILMDRFNNPKFNNMRESRMDLPVMQEIDTVVNTVANCPVVVVSSSTGSGKSTQIPLELLRYSYYNSNALANVMVAQPKRISAISIARHVSKEMCDPKLGDVVGYSIRLSKVTSGNTRINFMTNGYLLRYLVGNPTLDHVTHVIIDEVHERTAEIDSILYYLKELLKKRSDLRVLLMSATSHAESLLSYFHGYSTLVKIEKSHTHIVTPFFLNDVLNLIDKKYGIHETADFRTDGTFRLSNIIQDDSTDNDEDEGDDDAQNKNDLSAVKSINPDIPQDVISEEATRKRLEMAELRRDALRSILPNSGWRLDKSKVRLREICALILLLLTNTKGSILVFLPGMFEIRAVQSVITEVDVPMLLYILHGDEESDPSVFEPSDTVKVILSTDIAETGVTIPDVTVVIDGGFTNELRYSTAQKSSALRCVRISKASAMQRRGRAGRVADGTCYHMFSNTEFEVMKDHRVPEIHRIPLSDIYLSLARLFDGDVETVLAETISPPDHVNVRNASHFLMQIGVLDDEKRLTHLGKLISELPLQPSFGKALIAATKLKSLDDILTFIASFSINQSPFIKGMHKEYAKIVSGCTTYISALQSARGVARQICRDRQTFREAERSLRLHGLSLDVILSIETYRLDLLKSLSQIRLIPKSYTMSNFVESISGRRFAKCPPELNSMNSPQTMAYVISVCTYPNILFKYNEGLRILNSTVDITPQTDIIHPPPIRNGYFYCTTNVRTIVKQKTVNIVSNIFEIPAGIVLLSFGSLTALYYSGKFYDAKGSFGVNLALKAQNAGGKSNAFHSLDMISGLQSMYAILKCKTVLDSMLYSFDVAHMEQFLGTIKVTPEPFSVHPEVLSLLVKQLKTVYDAQETVGL